ncbi:hypothetical protein D3C71_1406810 [compost metagenome]
MDAEVAVHPVDQLQHAAEFALDLVQAAEDMRIVQRHGAHPVKACQGSGHFIPVHGAELRDADRQIPVAVHAALVDHHVMRTVHRTQHELLGVDRHLREHVFLVMIPVAGGLVQIHVAENRCVHMLIAKAGFDVNDITFQYAAQLGALRQPDRQALADELVECEDFKLLAELAVVALLRFLQQMQVLVQLRFLDPGGAVHAL